MYTPGAWNRESVSKRKKKQKFLCAEDDIDGSEYGLMQFTKEENLPLQQAQLLKYHSGTI